LREETIKRQDIAMKTLVMGIENVKLTNS